MPTDEKPPSKLLINLCLGLSLFVELALISVIFAGFYLGY